MTTRRHDVRRLAMQVLYQVDVRGTKEGDPIEEGLEAGPDSAKVQAEARELAEAAWRGRADADRVTAELAPDWPTHRQPPVDRAIIRLAYHEMASGRAPIGVAINEAVLLAKEYCAEDSPAFINGVLDKIAKGLIGAERDGKAAEEQAAADAADQAIADATTVRATGEASTEATEAEAG